MLHIQIEHVEIFPMNVLTPQNVLLNKSYEGI